MWGRPGRCRVLSNRPSTTPPCQEPPPQVVTTTDVPRHCPVSPGDRITPRVGTTSLRDFHGLTQLISSTLEAEISTVIPILEIRTHTQQRWALSLGRPSTWVPASNCRSHWPSYLETSGHLRPSAAVGCYFQTMLVHGSQLSYGQRSIPSSCKSLHRNISGPKFRAPQNGQHPCHKCATPSSATGPISLHGQAKVSSSR